MTKKLNEKRSSEKDKSFKAGDYAVYPSHGVSKILAIETNEIGGQEFNVLVLYFEKEKLTIKAPITQIETIGIRHLASKEQIEEVFTVLKSGIKKLKGMWSRRAQEYESKINSGDIMLLAEVLRDLTRDIEDGDRSYSERIIYETAIYRLASEYAVTADISFDEAKEEIISTAKNKIGHNIVAANDSEKDSFDDDFDLDDDDDDDDDDGDDDDDDDDD